MNTQDMKKLINAGENETIEFKRSTAQTDRALRTICGFLNHKGGVIYFGISDKNELVGQQISESTLKSISQKIRQKIKPETSPNIKVIEINKKKIIEVKVKEGANKPYYLDSIAYKRVGSETPPIAPEELEHIILKKKRYQWDTAICEGATLADIDEEKVKWYMEKRGINKPEDMLLNDFLISIKAASKNRTIKPTNAGILFFSKHPQSFLLQARIHCVRFDSTDICSNTTDELLCEGTIKEMIQKAEEFINKNTRLYGFRTEMSFKRIEKKEYPIMALREAIINALIHRQYDMSSEIKLFIFENRMEILNPGSFREGVSPEHPVHLPRNSILCEYAKDIQYIEKFGSGIYMMKKLCKQWGIPEPKYIIDSYWTKIIFEPSQAGVILSEMIKDRTTLNNRQINAINYVFKYNSITNEEYQNINNIGRTTTKSELRQLVEKGVFDMKGSGKGTHYILGMTIK